MLILSLLIHCGHYHGQQLEIEAAMFHASRVGLQKTIANVITNTDVVLGRPMIVPPLLRTSVRILLYILAERNPMALMPIGTPQLNTILIGMPITSHYFSKMTVQPLLFHFLSALPQLLRGRRMPLARKT